MTFDKPEKIKPQLSEIFSEEKEKLTEEKKHSLHSQLSSGQLTNTHTHTP